MTLLSKVGSFQTGTGTSNIPVTGLGFQPKAVIFYAAKQTGDGQGAAGHMCIGFATSSTERGCARIRSGDNQASSSVSSIIRNDACWTIELDGGGVSGILDFVSMDSDGFTVIPDDGFSGDLRIFYLALGGDSLTNAQVVTGNLTTGAGVQAIVSGLAFQPDTVFAISTGGATFNSSGGVANLVFGAARSATENGCVAMLSENSANPSDTRSIIRDDTFMLWPSTSGDNIRVNVDFSAFTSDGFSIDKIQTDNTLLAIVFLCLKGISAKIGTVAAKTTTGTTPVTGVGFKPSAVILASNNMSTTIPTNPTPGAEMMFGASSAAAVRGSCWVGDPDGITPTDNQNRNDSGRLWIDYDISTPFAVQGEADIQTFDSGGYTLNTPTAFPAANLALSIALGPAAAAAPAGKVRIVGALA